MKAVIERLEEEQGKSRRDVYQKRKIIVKDELRSAAHYVSEANKSVMMPDEVMENLSYAISHIGNAIETVLLAYKIRNEKLTSSLVTARKESQFIEIPGTRG